MILDTSAPQEIAAMAARSTRRRTTIAYGASTSDHGPNIRALDLHVPARLRPDGTLVEAGYTREASVSRASWPDPKHPDRQQDVSGSVSWLPLRLYKARDLTTAQIIMASRYRDHLDMAAGASDRGAGGGGKAPWDRNGVTDCQLGARLTLDAAAKALGAETIRTLRAFVMLDTLLEVAMAIGITRGRVAEVAAKALDDLDGWWSKR